MTYSIIGSGNQASARAGQGGALVLQNLVKQG